MKTNEKLRQAVDDLGQRIAETHQRLAVVKETSKVTAAKKAKR